MQLRPDEEPIPTSINKVQLTNLRLRYTPNKQIVQSMFLREISSMNIIKTDVFAYLILAVIGVMLLLAGVISGDRFSRLMLLSGGVMVVLFGILYFLSRRSYLQIIGRGSNEIKIKLSGADIHASKELIEKIETAKMNITE